MGTSEPSSRKSIAEHFEGLADPRSEVNREHLLVDVIVISICAILAGADGPTAIAMWAKSPSVAAWLKQHLTLAQVATAEKSHEITAIPQLLDLIDVTGAIVTSDAMGTQTAIAAKIVDGGGDYVLPLKGNQSQMEQAVTEHFAEHLEDNFARVKVSRLETTETHHGRVEQRSYFQVNVPDDLPGHPRWKGLRTLGLVIRTREINPPRQTRPMKSNARSAA